MSKCSHNRMRFQYGAQLQLAMGLAIALVTATSALANTENARLATFDSSTGETSFALSLMPSLDNAAAAPAHVVIYLDTSASQTGMFRDDAIKALKSVLVGLDPADKVQLYAVDIDPVALTDGFVAPDSSEMNVALERLNERLPLGSTDISAMLENAGQLLDQPVPNKNVIYIGDGISRGALIATDRFENMVRDLVGKRISVSSFAIGPERDVEMLAALANHTGGNVFVDSDDVGSSDQAAAGLVTTARGLVFWPNEMKKPAQMTEMFPPVVPPLRSDRDTILIGSLSERGSFDVIISGDVNGEKRQFTWPVQAEGSDADFNFLPELLDIARESGGTTLPTVGSAGLREMARVIMASSHQITSLGASVLNAGSAAANASAVQEDVAPSQPPQPGNDTLQEPAPDALVLEEPQQQIEELPGQAGGLNLIDQNVDDEQFLRESAGSPQFLGSIEQQRQAAEQRLEAYMENEMRIARDLMSTKPDQGMDRLKAMLDTIQRAPDLRPAIRMELETRVRSQLRQANVQKQEFDTRLALANRQRTIAEERLNLLRAFEDREEKVAQYVATFTALMDERNYQGALDVIKAAVDLYPDSPDMAAAEEVSIMKVNWDRYWEVRNAKNRNFLENLYEVERSAIPFSGEPPLVFPDANEWITKKELRKKWRNVRVAGNKREEAILEALEKDAKFDYFETRFGDVVQELRADYRIPIVIDDSAADNNLDEEALITLDLENVSLRSGLRIMLKPFQCTYVVKDEVLYIMSEDFALDNLVINIYNVGDLVAPRGAVGGGLGGGGGGFGGGGQGGGGRGGGGGGFGGGGGGGVFCITDDLELGSKKTDEREPVALQVQPAQGQTVKTAWTEYFSKYHADPADVRETVRSLMKGRKSGEVVAVIEGCMQNGQTQDWMYEGIMLAMQISGASTEEVERAVMTSVDFSDNPDDLMSAALFMTKHGMERRSLKLLRSIAESNPARHEPFAIAMRAARAIEDDEAIQWATLGILAQEWPENPEILRDAFLAAESIKLDLQRSGNVAALKTFESQLAEALYRDCIIKITWTGDADLDLYVEEPGGTICSRENTRSLCGGVMMGDNASRRDESGQVSEYYVVPRGFTGDYRMAIRRVWGEVPTGKVTVEVYRNYRSPDETSMKRQVKMDDTGAIVVFNLDKGRRTEKLNLAAIQTAAAQEFLADRGLMAQRLAGYSESSASRHARSANPDRQRQIARNQLNPRDAGFRPEIEVFPTGIGMSVQATTADRLYVIVSTPFQLFSDITEVSTFNFVTGDTGVTGGGAGGTGGGAGGG